jgi:hypothetical protein
MIESIAYHEFKLIFIADYNPSPQQNNFKIASANRIRFYLIAS